MLQDRYVDSTLVEDVLQHIEFLSDGDVAKWSKKFSDEYYKEVGSVRCALEDGDEWDQLADRIQLPLRLKVKLERLLRMPTAASPPGIADLLDVFPTLKELLAFQQNLKNGMKLPVSKKGFTEIPVPLLRWTQDTIHQNMLFRAGPDGRPMPEDTTICIWQTLDQLLHGSLKLESFRLKVLLDACNFWCLDNRRLTVLKMYQATKQNQIVKVWCKIYTPDHVEIKKEYESKMTTRHEGLMIRPGGNIKSKTLHLGADAFNQAEQAYKGMQRVAELDAILNLASLRDKIASTLEIQSRVFVDKKKKKQRNKAKPKANGKDSPGKTAQVASSSAALIADEGDAAEAASDSESSGYASDFEDEMPSLSLDDMINRALAASQEPSHDDAINLNEACTAEEFIIKFCCDRGSFDKGQAFVEQLQTAAVCDEKEYHLCCIRARKVLETLAKESIFDKRSMLAYAEVCKDIRVPEELAGLLARAEPSAADGALRPSQSATGLQVNTEAHTPRQSHARQPNLSRPSSAVRLRAEVATARAKVEGKATD